MKRAFLYAALFATIGKHAALAETPLVLNLPIDCRPGEDCVVQNYVDHDGSSKSRDFKCGSKTYDAHNGTDFRIPSHLALTKGVSVLAAAPGIVDRMRDGEHDVSVRIAGPASVANKECGNAVVVNHAGGWSTQYCHMAKGSVVVKPGQHVAAGDKIGQVGLSGNTEYPHLHLSVRHNGTLVDPFSFGSTEACGSGQSLWNEALAVTLQYREIEALNRGFVSKPITMEDIESGDVLSHPLTKDSALVAYTRVIGLRAGDVQSLTIFAPDGSTFASQTFPPSDADKAQAFISIGRRNPKDDWQSGKYRAEYTVRRANVTVFQTSFDAAR
jgi:hypothetical protein